MILRLNLSNESRWLDPGHGVRLPVEPLTTAVMLAARSDPAIIVAAMERSRSFAGRRHRPGHAKGLVS